MVSPESTTYSLNSTDTAELNKLVSFLQLSSGTTTIFAIAPESGPQHPVVEEVKSLVAASDTDFYEPQNFFYSDNSLYNFIYSWNETECQNSPNKRKLVMAFGIDQLPTSRLAQEMKQLNLGRESLFGRQLVLIFWLNKEEFLEEFRNRAPDFWDWRGKVMKFQARPPANPLFYSYLEWLIAENSYLKISGVMQVQRQVDIFLDQIYVSLQAIRRQEITETSKLERDIMTSRQADYKMRVSMSSSSPYDLGEPSYYEPILLESIPVSTTTKTVTQKIDISYAVRDNQYCVILGAPGAGKTTLLRYLALHFAIAKRDGNETVTGGETQENLGKTLLPIFFRIADYAERLQQQPELTLLDYLRQFHRQWEAYFQDDAGIEMAALLLEKMHQGQCLMLLDGLDEVFEQESRRKIVERIDQFVNAFSTNKFVITSRIAGYRDVKLSSRFAEFTIEDMASEQVEKFLHRWCLAIERAQQPEASETQWQRAGDDQAKKILAAIKDNEGVKRLTANPLLLTILALIHRNGDRLPNRRVKLYELAVQTLTEDWQLGKKLPDASKVLLNQNEVVAFLAPLAYWMHEEKPSGLVTEAEVEQQLAAKLAELNDTDPESDSVRQAVQEFLRKVRETTGLFVERAPGVYGFMHLTFEEYFAALYIADNEPSDILKIIREHLYEPRWNEPILLALGYYGNSIKLVNKLVDQLFGNLEAYKPTIQAGKLKIKNASSPDATIIWSALPDESNTNYKHSVLRLKDLFFAGDILTQVEVYPVTRKKIIQQLVITYIALDTDFETDTTKQLLKMLRQIELFNQKGEVIAQLKELASNSTLNEEIRIKAQTAIFYVACGESGAGLVNCVTDIVNQLEPNIFCSLRDLIEELGEEISPELETSRHIYNISKDSQRALTFLTAMSYLREDNYEKAIGLLEEITVQHNNNLSAYIAWSIATCYQEQDKLDQASDYYQECFEKLALYIHPSAFLLFWRNRGICHRLHGKYEQSLECFQQALTIDRERKKSEDEASDLWHIGKTYQEWGKYEQAIARYQQSRDLYEQLGKENNVASQLSWLGNCYQEWGKYEQAIVHNQQSLDLYEQLGEEKNVATQWYWLGDCYREWGKYEQAVECQHKELVICQISEDQMRIAVAYWRLGRIYQNWGKYEQAIAYYQQSLDLYEQLGKEKSVSARWYNMAGCYREWGKYQQALECELRDLEICQKLEDQSEVALAYCQLGYIYREWGKYQQAIAHYQQSHDLYEQLGKEKDVANQWSNLAGCYREWGKYQQAVECQQKCLAQRQQLEDQPDIAIAYFQLGSIYQSWGKYEQAIAHYQQSRELYEQLGKEKDVATQWYWLGDCYREWGKYQQAVECQQKELEICQTLEDQTRIAPAHWQLGRIYQNWGKYEQAIAHHQQSYDLYEQLGKENNIANQWSWLGNCYREWGKYQQAVKCLQKELAIRQQLDEQANIANAYTQLGSIYQVWGKYEQAIAHYQQSRELYEQLGKEKNVANQWSWLGYCYREWGKYEQAIAHYKQSHDLYEQLGKEKSVSTQWYNMAGCYREWGKYQQALECELKDLEICQKLEDQSEVALAYYQLGSIYQAWGKYEQMIAHYQQSRDLYEQLDKQKNVANQWSNLAACYREWGKHEQALDCELKDLAIRQQLADQVNIASAYYQLGRIYQGWGKYEQAIAQYEQSRDLYEQLDKQKNVANQWYWLSDCYGNWGKYQQAVECLQKCLAKRQILEDQSDIASAYFQLGWIYQGWGKYEQAIAHFQQSRDLYEQLDKQQDVAYLWSWLAGCYRDLEDYTKAIEYYQQSRNIYQQIGHNESMARRCRQIGNSQRLLAKNTPDRETAFELLAQAEQNIRQAIQISSVGDYKKNLAYNYIVLSLIWSERLQILSFDNSLSQEEIAQFEEYYNTGLTYFDELGQIINKAERVLNIARAYLEVSVLENLDLAEELAQESLQVFQEYNSRKLEASARKLLGEIYLSRAQRHQSSAKVIAIQFLTQSLEIYRELDLTGKAAEVQKLIS